MKPRNISILGAAIIAGLAVLTAVAFLRTESSTGLAAFSQKPAGVMGTESHLIITTLPETDPIYARTVLQNAETALRRAEAMMSVHINSTELARLNAAGAGPFKLSPETLEVLQTAHRFYQDTEGAFDVTCQPIIKLWKQAGKEGRSPTEEERRAARVRSQWRDLEFSGDGVIKKRETARIDLGGIAKGHGIDKALEAMQAGGVEGGLVDVGGDIRVFGRPESGKLWQVGIRDPFKQNTVLAQLGIKEGAVCTSGNYFRFFEIQGKRFSHIIDPRTGLPIETAASVTVLAPTAMTADAWATALSVLGPEGFEILPENKNVEAMIVTGSEDDPQIHMTKGFKKVVLSEN